MADQSGDLARQRSRSYLVLVDDDPALLDALSGTLKAGLGHCSLDTDSGAKALELAKSQHYDTIILDVNMPNTDGFEVLAAVKQVQPETPVFMITGRPDRTMMARAFEAGADDFIPKPFDREDVVQAVRRGLELSRLQSIAVRLEGRHRNALQKADVVKRNLQQRAVRRLEEAASLGKDSTHREPAPNRNCSELSCSAGDN